MALDADTGKVVWEYKFNIFQSDVPPHRVGWASPAADPETGNIYALERRRARSIALSKDGKLLWERSIGEEFAAFTTHGGRTMSPLVDGDLVIVSAAISSWGTQANRAHRFIALDKRTGDIVCVAKPGGRPYDTAYAAPLIATINGMRLLIAGTRRRRGPRHQAADRREGLELRRRQARDQHRRRRQRQRRVIVSHGDENLDTSELGMIARDRRIADRRHQDDEVGGQGRSVRLLVAGHRRHARLPDRQRLAAEGVRRRNRARAVAAAARHRCRRRRSCWPTASSTSAPKAASSSSSGRTPTAARS